MARHPSILSADHALLLIVDVQESFRKVLPDPGGLAKRISILVDGARELALPVIVTEQYPRGLGKTFDEIRSRLDLIEANNSEKLKIFEKDCFSACGSSDFNEALIALGRRQVIVCGIETHVCINQTCHDLISRGYQVHLLEDAVDSRFPENKSIAIRKLIAAGAIISSVEMALFEMLVESGTQRFKAVQALVK